MQGERKEDRSKAKLFTRQIRWFLAGLVVLGVVGVATLVIVASTTHEAKTDAEIAKESAAYVRTTLKSSCEKLHNPLRAGLREHFRSLKFQALHPDPRVLEALHLQLSQKEIRQLTEVKVRQLNYSINVRFKPINCKRRYGSGE